MSATDEWAPEKHVPEISDERLAELMKRIRPVVRRKGELREIRIPNPRTTAFTWDPALLGYADGLTVVARTTTRHLFGAPALFKPSIAEVLAQLPEDNDAIVAFCIDEQDLDYRNVDSRGFHTAITSWLAVDPHANPVDRVPTDEESARALGWSVDKSTYPWKASDSRSTFARRVNVSTPAWEPTT